MHSYGPKYPHLPMLRMGPFLSQRERKKLLVCTPYNPQERNPPLFRERASIVCISLKRAILLACCRSCSSDFGADVCEQRDQVRTYGEHDHTDGNGNACCNQAVLNCGSPFFAT